MGKLIPTLLTLHSKDLEERLLDAVQATGLSKSAVARAAINDGFPRVMEMSRGQILAMSHNDLRMTKLPRLSTHLDRRIDRMISDFASALDLPVWRIYSVAIDVGL